MTKEVEVSTSPRSTWVWARDVAEAEQLRVMLLAADCNVVGNRNRSADSRELDVDIGYEALAALQVLSDAGYSFRWHPDQYSLNRQPLVLGFPILGPGDFPPEEEGKERTYVSRSINADDHYVEVLEAADAWYELVHQDDEPLADQWNAAHERLGDSLYALREYELSAGTAARVGPWGGHRSATFAVVDAADRWLTLHDLEEEAPIVDMDDALNWLGECIEALHRSQSA